ncbi:MAG: M48 family metalloprotease [Thermoplasmatales archaeon]|nr:MAG: M48 family metalloprotease [Thermoplasmatales archaeon]
MFAILYGIIVGIGYFLGYSGSTFYIFIIGIALALILVQYAIGPKTVEWSMRIKYVNEKEYPKLHRMVEDLAHQAGLPKKPKIGVSKLQIPNAFAFGRTMRGARVCVTEGILNLLSDEELKSVLGHEISHIKHRDVAVITMLSVVPMVCYILYITFFWGGMFGRRQRDSGAMIAIGLLALVVYFIASLLVMYGSRIREYYADLSSTELGNEPHHLATALYKLSLGSAKMSKKALKQTEGMKAFFLNDPSRAMYEVRELKDIDIDMSGTIDQNELMILSTKEVKLNKSDKLMEVLSTHPNMVKRIKHLASLPILSQTVIGY